MTHVFFVLDDNGNIWDLLFLNKLSIINEETNFTSIKLGYDFNWYSHEINIISMDCRDILEELDTDQVKSKDNTTMLNDVQGNIWITGNSNQDLGIYQSPNS